MTTALALVGVGVAAGLSAVVLHSRAWGLVLGVGATAAALWALPDRWWGRLPFAAGWAVALVVLAAGRAEGDYVISADGSGYVLLAGGFVVVVLGVVSLRPRRHPPLADSGPAGPTS